MCGFHLAVVLVACWGDVVIGRPAAAERYGQETRIGQGFDISLVDGSVVKAGMGKVRLR